MGLIDSLNYKPTASSAPTGPKKPAPTSGLLAGLDYKPPSASPEALSEAKPSRSILTATRDMLTAQRPPAPAQQPFESIVADPFGSMAASTPQTTAMGTEAVLKAFAQGMGRSYLAAGQALVTGDAKKPFPTEESDAPYDRLIKSIAGTNKPFSIATEDTDLLGEKIGGFTGGSVSLALTALDLVGGSGVKGIAGLTKTLKTVDNVTDAAKVLRSAGFDDDIVREYASVFARTTDEKKIEQGLLAAQRLQESTKPLATKASQTPVTPITTDDIATRVAIAKERASELVPPKKPTPKTAEPANHAIKPRTVEPLPKASADNPPFKELGKLTNESGSQAAERIQAGKLTTHERQAVEMLKERKIIDPDYLKEKVFGDTDTLNHDRYSEIAKVAYKEALKENPNPVVRFTAGGSGSGKGEILLNKKSGNGLLKEFDGITVDGTFANYSSARKKIDQAIAAGKTPEVYAIMPRIESAWKFAQKREITKGRGVPLHVFAEAHSGFIDTTRKLVKDGDVKIYFHDARGHWTKKASIEAPFFTDRSKILAKLNEVRYTKEDLMKQLEHVKLSKKSATKTRREALIRAEARRRELHSSEVPVPVRRGAVSGDERGVASAGGVREVPPGKSEGLVHGGGGNGAGKPGTGVSDSVAPRAGERGGIENSPPPKIPPIEKLVTSPKVKSNKPIVSTSKDASVSDKIASSVVAKAHTSQDAVDMMRTYDVYAEFAALSNKAERRAETHAMDYAEYAEKMNHEDSGMNAFEMMRSYDIYIDEAKKQQLTVPTKQTITAQKLVQFASEFKDIGNVRSALGERRRIFERVFGKHAAEAKKLYLDPLDDSIGKHIDDMDRLKNQMKGDIIEKLGIKPHTKEAQFVVDFGEKTIDFEQVQRVVGMKRAEDIKQAAQWFRKEYDTLIDQLNVVRKEIYPNSPEKLIQKRKDYFRHGKEMSEGIQGLRNLFETSAAIDPTLAGVSDFTTPRSKWLSFAQRRLGIKNDFDAIEGYLNYLPSWSYAMNIDPHIGKFRTLQKELALATDESRHVNNFIEWLHDFANDLSGKTNPADRAWQKYVPGGRRTSKVLTWLNSRIKANVIVGNLSSSIAQAFNIPQGVASAKAYAIPGMSRTLGSIFAGNIPISKSPFIRERYFDTRFTEFDEGILNNTKKFAVWLTGALDQAGTKFIWNSHYEKAVAQGMADPIRYADDVTSKLVAGRGIGSVPLLQKSQLFQLVAPFQLEVTNLWYVMGDMVRKKDFAALATLFVTSYLMNRVAEQIRGSDVTFDPVQASMEGINSIREEENVGRGILKAGGRLGGEVLSNLSFGQTLATLVPEDGISVGGLAMSRAELFGRGDPTRFGSGILIWKGIQDPASKVLPAFGGMQLLKTFTGAKALVTGETTSATGKQKYEIEPSVLNSMQALLFGPNSTREGRAFNKEASDLYMRLDRQSTERSELLKEAEKEYADLHALAEKTDQETAMKKLQEIGAENPALADKIVEVAQDRASGLNGTERLIKQLGVENGERASYIVQQVNKLKSQEEKRAYLQNLDAKDLISDTVYDQIMEQLHPKT